MAFKPVSRPASQPDSKLVEVNSVLLAIQCITVPMRKITSPESQIPREIFLRTMHRYQPFCSGCLAITGQSTLSNTNWLLQLHAFIGQFSDLWCELRMQICLNPLLLYCEIIIFVSIQPQNTRNSPRRSFLQSKDRLVHGSATAWRHGRDVGGKERHAFDGTFGTAAVSVFQVEGGTV